MTTVCGTGTREIVKNESLFFQIVDRLCETINELHPLHIISGMAEGFDEALARAAIRCKIPWTAAIPNHRYLQYYWGENSKTGRNRYHIGLKLVEKASNRVYVCGNMLYENGLHANFVRNHWMVDHSDEVWAHNPDNSKGTGECMTYAKKQGKPIRVVV